MIDKIFCRVSSDVENNREFAHGWIFHKLRHKRLAENHLMTSAELQNQVLNNILCRFLLFVFIPVGTARFINNSRNTSMQG